MATHGSESLLVFSDVHLGSDIHDGALNKGRRSTAIDRDLIQLLAHYRRQKPKAERWRIVIAGDFIDFIGMTIPPEQATLLETPPTEEEQRHGLGSAADHARLKLHRVAQRHADVFTALATFVADGHALTLVHGNHDIEFHWDTVKDDFREILFALATEAGAKNPSDGERTDDASSAGWFASDRSSGPSLDRTSFLERIEFNPWFFYRDGVAYIEHGHQYDPYCATAHVMAPISPLDPRRVARGFSDTLLRYVVRPTLGMTEHGHERVGIAHYVTFGVKLGLSGMFRLGACFTSAVAELFRLRRAYVSQAASVLRAEHEQRVAKLAEATRIGKDRLRALLSLQVPPVTSSVRGILASVLLDRLALAMVSAIAIVVLATMSAFRGHMLWGCVAILVVWSLLNRYLSSQRQVDPANAMVDRAAHLARLFPAAFVVMGHTHVPQAMSAGNATYVNVGSWSEEEPAGESGYRAARTHLVIDVGEQGAEAQFCSWEPQGPKPLELPLPPRARDDAESPNSRGGPGFAPGISRSTAS